MDDEVHSLTRACVEMALHSFLHTPCCVPAGGGLAVKMGRGREVEDEVHFPLVAASPGSGPVPGLQLQGRANNKTSRSPCHIFRGMSRGRKSLRQGRAARAVGQKWQTSVRGEWRRFCLDGPGGFVPGGSPQRHPFPEFKERLGGFLPNQAPRADSLLFELEGRQQVECKDQKACRWQGCSALPSQGSPPQ